MTFGRLELFLDSGVFILRITDEANIFILFISRHSWVLFRRLVDLLPVFYNVGLHTTFLVAKTAIPLHLHWSSSSCLSRWKIFPSFVPVLQFLVVFGRTTYSISPDSELIYVFRQAVSRLESLFEWFHSFLFYIINWTEALAFYMLKSAGRIFSNYLERKIDDSQNYLVLIIFCRVKFCWRNHNGLKLR